MKKGKQIAMALVAASMMSTPFAGITIQAQQAAGTEDWSYATDYTKMMMTPGSNETMLNFAWYATQDDVNKGKAMVQMALKSSLVNGEWPPAGNAYQTFVADTTQAIQENDVQYYTNKASVSGLQENTAYVYRYTSNGGKTWSEIETYTTKDFDSFTLLYVGDPQIGSSGNSQADTQGWTNTLSMAVSMYPQLSHIISVGDQVEKADNASSNPEKKFEVEMAGYLDPATLRSLPVATLVGNHESGAYNLSYHTNNPNTSSLGATKAGSDYYYTYGNTLFMVLNTNNSNAAEHDSFLQQTIAANPDVKWKVVSFHQDIYGSGAPHSDSDGAVVRNWIDPVLNKYDVDVVLTGHDHSYTRSYQLKDGQIVENNLEDDANRVINPEGMVYMTANSASGSKYYDLIANQQYYVAYRDQTRERTFSILDIDDVSFSIKTVNAETGQLVDKPYTIVKSAAYEDFMALIEKVKQQLEDTDSYTPASVEALQAAYQTAIQLQQGELSEEAIGSAYADLNNAKNALMKKADTTDLKKALDDAKTVLEKAQIGTSIGQYPEKAKTTFQKTYEEIMKAAADVNLTQAQADALLKKLDAAMLAFENEKIGKEAVSNGQNDDKKKDETQSSTTDSVNTGDQNKAGLLAGSLGVSILVIGGTIIVMKRKREI